jgi:hypothetical protein
VQITLDPSLQNDADLSAAVAARNPLLESIINGSAAQAEWRRGTNWKGQPAVLLRLLDPSGARAGADFLPVEFKNDQQLGERLRELKEAILKVHHWRIAVEKLFTAFRAWCDRLPKKERRGATYPVLVLGETIRVAEGLSGEYDISQLVVKRISTVRITPVAAWVVGWDGRVDLIGPGDRSNLLYRQGAGRWYHVPNDLPYRELPLTEALFLDLVETCLDEDVDE